MTSTLKIVFDKFVNYLCKIKITIFLSVLKYRLASLTRFDICYTQKNLKCVLMQIFNFDKNDQIMYSKEIKSHQIIHLECLTHPLDNLAAPSRACS